MKLFLTSEEISYQQGCELIKLIGKPSSEIKIALIENAADNYGGDRSWVDDARNAIECLGVQLNLIDLRDYATNIKKEPLMYALKNNDVIWIGGGNVYYLRWIMAKTNADVIIRRLIRGGTIYAGTSAGAIIAGPTIECFEEADDPSDAPEKMLEGLKVLDFIPIPHWDDKKYGPKVKKAAKNLEKLGFSTVSIKENQALIIDGGMQRLI